VTEGPVLRLFFALWPDPASRRALVRATRAAVRHSGGRPVAEDNLHLTLVFLGGVDAPGRGCCEAAADALRAPAFTLTLDTLGHWPRARVLWAGCTQVPPPLAALAASLAAALVPCGYRPEPRPFRPHVTLARKVACWKGGARADPVSWPVRELCLAASVTDPAGARYRVLRRWPLAG